MPSVTRPVEKALSGLNRCDSWLLYLDKLSFAGDSQAESRTTTLKEVRKKYDAASAKYLSRACKDREAWLGRCRSQHGERFGELELKAESRLLLQLGRAGVLENTGVSAERITGLPVIPGTALKGVLSTWACWSEHFNDFDGSFRPFTVEGTERQNFTAQDALLARQILGDNSADGSDAAGNVIFLGGFPTTPPKLGLDIVNPHHSADGTVASKLTPNTFLCFEPGTIWRFAFYVRTGTPQARDLIATTQRWIAEALTQTGIGAKTAAGYGRFLSIPSRGVSAKPDLAPLRIATAKEIEISKAQAAGQAILAQDYPNAASFKSRVLDLLNPGRLDQLKAQISLLGKPENQAWLDELKRTLASKDFKDMRKRLAEKDWFPKDWLPKQ